MQGNPMIQNLMVNRMGQTMAPIKNLMNTIRNASNPQMMFQQMVSQNPKLQQVMKYVQDSGGDAKSAFYKMANEQGIDPNTILNQLM